MSKKIRQTAPKEKTKQHIVADTPTHPAPPSAGKFSILSFRTQAIILTVLGFLFYCNTFLHESAFDDMMAITDNDYVQRGFAGIPDILTKDAYQSYLEHKNGSNQLAGGRYRPLSLITFAIEQQLMSVSNESETANAKEARIAQEMHTRHVVNVLLYILCVITLLCFLRYVVFPNDPLTAFLAALLFTVHPIHTEVVANVKSRDEILSVLFISLTFIKAFKYHDKKKTSDLVLAVICFFCALLSKEYAVTLVALLPLSFYLFRKETLGKSFKFTLPYLIPLGVYFIMRFTSITSAAEGAENNIMNNPYLLATGTQKLATEIMAMLDYVKLLFFPSPLCSDYSYNQIPYTTFSNPLVWLSLLVYIGLIAAMCLLFIKRHLLSFAIAIYLANLALISNILFNIGAPMGERLIFHSSIGFVIIIAYLLSKGFKKIKQPSTALAALATFMVIMAILCGYKTIARNNDWKNDSTLFLTDVKTCPNSALLNNNAAAACMSFAKQNKENVPLRNEWFTKAINYFDKAIAIYPQHWNARLNRGLCYFNMGFPDKALPDWDSVRKNDPGLPNIQKYLNTAGRYFSAQGVRYNSTGQPDSAIISFKKATDASPGIPEMWVQLGNAYKAVGREEEAKQAFEHTKPHL